MNPPASLGRASVVLLAALSLAACKDSKNTASSALPGGDKKFEATCESAAAEYGVDLGVAMEKQLKDAAGLRNAIRDAVVTACKEDGWDAETLGCLTAAAEYKQRNGKSMGEPCIKSLSPETQAKMDDRIKTAITQ